MRYSYIAHRVAKAPGPAEQVEAWIRRVLAQVIDRTAARQSRAIVRNAGDEASAEAGAGALNDIRDLLRTAVRAAGSRQVELDTNAVFDLTFAVLRRHAQADTAPSPAECEHLVRFCLTGAGIAPRRADGTS
jgi:hypothetical protein